MRPIASGIRTEYLSGTVTPTLAATLRQLRLEFQDDSGRPWPIVFNSYNTIDAGLYAGDDKEGRLAWGDSCVIEGTVKAKLRLFNKAVWGDTADYFASYTEDGQAAADWNYADITNSATTPANYCRVGIYPKVSDETGVTVYAWYVSGTSVYREELTRAPAGAWSWANKTGSGASIASPGFDAVALHPVSAAECFVVGFKTHYLWCRYLNWNGLDWDDSGIVHTIWSSQDLGKWDALFSDAEGLGDGKYVLVVNLASHGTTHSLVYSAATDFYSQPYLMLGGGTDDTAYRVLCAGLASINGRVWAVTWRAIEGSDEVPYAYHAALASTTDGRHWRDGDFVGSHLCYGKLLAASEETYCYVAGNAVVYRAAQTNALGNDAEAMKKTITEATAWQLSFGGAGSAASVESNLINVGSALSGSSLLRAGNELSLEIGTVAQGNATLFKAYLARKARELRWGADSFRLYARGPLYNLAGDGAYQPPAGRMYESPTSWQTNFNLEGGSARQSVSTRTGTWETVKDSSKGVWVLRGRPGTTGEGIAIVPRAIHSPWITAALHFKALVSVEGIFLVFFYEDDDNYWRAGLYNDAGQRKLVIQRVSAGIATTKQSSNIDPAIGTWYSLYLDATPQQVRCFWKDSDTNDFSGATADVTYALSGESTGIPLPQHLGLMVIGRADETQGDDYGVVTKAFAKQIQDSSKDFTASVIGKYLHVDVDWRRVVDYTVVQDDAGHNIALTVDSPWSAVPDVGTAWGLYATEGDPHALFSDLAWCDGLPAWTLDDITSSLLCSAGVNRSASGGFTGDVLPTLATSSQHRDIDVRITGDLAPSLIVHASVTSAADYTGWKVNVDGDYHYLYHVLNGAATLSRKLYNLRKLIMTDEPEIRVVVSEDNIYLYADGHYIGGFPAIGTSGRGYVAKNSDGTFTITEFGTMQESFVWGAEESPNSALGRLLRGRYAKLVERADGSVVVSVYGDREDLGTWSTPINQRGEVVDPVPSLIEMAGAEVRAYYLEPEVARYGLRFRRSDNPTAISEAETLDEAQRTADLARESGDRQVVSLYAPDPGCEIEDTVTVNDVVYIVDSYNFYLARDLDSIQAGMIANLRTRIAAVTPGAWGTAVWGQFYLG